MPTVYPERPFETRPEAGGQPPRVQLFVTCLCDLFYPDTGASTVRLLRRLGVAVEFPSGQTCCGQPGYTSGHAEDARAVAKHLIEAFAGTDTGKDARDLPIVTPSGSCAAMIRHHYPRLFGDDPHWEPRAKAFARRVHDLSEYLVHHIGVERVRGRYEATAVYHRSCHMSRGLGVTREPLALLEAISGLTLVDLPYADDCCGFGGAFAVKMSDISTAMTDSKLTAVQDTQADLLVGSDLGCMMQMGGRLRRIGRPMEIMHLAELLDRATAAASGGPVS